MTVRPLQPADRERWIAMRRSLWPEYPPEQIAAEAETYFRDQTIVGLPSIVFVSDELGHGPVGFAEASLRPFARGCVSSPVGYLEGWYVEPDARHRGIGKALVSAAEDWARDRGCSEFASDRREENLISRAAHEALGFRHTDRCALLHKELVDTVRPATDFIGIVDFELDAGSITQLVAAEDAGGIAIFLGTTRAEISPAGTALLALDYEAYQEMALPQLRELARLARDRWPIVKLAILHRIGRVALAEPSVVIAVSTPHRADSFQACQFLIDELKKSAAIWKKEVWADGSGTWVHPVEAG
jgi:molybdopterin synthase catalytic subunit